jgi:hypothetical protein
MLPKSLVCGGDDLPNRHSARLRGRTSHGDERPVAATGSRRQALYTLRRREKERIRRYRQQKMCGFAAGA